MHVLTGKLGGLCGIKREALMDFSKLKFPNDYFLWCKYGRMDTLQTEYLKKKPINSR